ncbi:hypothetical protein QFC24_003876 [Naganishia onofrii]|uniref:Uncharacterized protein n=1 Tax=Naganishia onofrii TaxID=1851511 RepID=A0ACC2XGW5_9TREE|nr:hypothetical protein QFC24_003876 [Naganishia onofrii]
MTRSKKRELEREEQTGPAAYQTPLKTAQQTQSDTLRQVKKQRKAKVGANNDERKGIMEAEKVCTN